MRKNRNRRKNLLVLIALMMASVILLSGCGSGIANSGADNKTWGTGGSGADDKTWRDSSFGADENSWGSSGSGADEKTWGEDVSRDWTGDDKDGVAQYLETYEKLPSNYMTKKEARKRGWEGGALHLVVPGMSIGGDTFGNYEGLLPEDKDYKECDIDTLKSDSRGAKRIIFSAEKDDLDIWYTDDHYESFDLLYGDGE